MIYAPIIIPTLNRYEHLKRCIDSLAANEYAKYTDLYISLDYPPGEKYVEGYNKVKQYLMAGITGFKNVYVFYQEKNLGPNDNRVFLRRVVMEQYDRFIFSEDDNVFAPCYLEYINKGLELYKDNKDIMAIYATGPGTEDERPKDDNVFKLKYFSAYGYGMWTDRRLEIEKTINRDYIEKVACNKKLLKKLYYENSVTICALASALLRKERVFTLPDGTVPVIDMTIMIYAAAEDKYIVCSKEHMVKNVGYDGSGVNCGDETAAFKGVELRTQPNFEYEVKGEPKYLRLRKERGLKHKIHVFLAYVKIVIWRFLANRKMV